MTTLAGDMITTPDCLTFPSFQASYGTEEEKSEVLTRNCSYNRLQSAGFETVPFMPN
jgi:hypothetical protein